MIAGAVLSAGASSRMGSPKALARVRGRTFLESMLMSLLDAGCDPVIAVLGHHSGIIERECDLSRVRVAVNPNPGLGQASSLLCAANEARGSEGLLFVLVDQAVILPETVEKVALGLRRAPCVVARHNGIGGHPTAFSNELLERLDEPLVQKRGARILVEELHAENHVLWVDVNDPGVIRNINSPRDLFSLPGSDLQR